MMKGVQSCGNIMIIKLQEVDYAIRGCRYTQEVLHDCSY